MPEQHEVKTSKNGISNGAKMAFFHRPAGIDLGAVRGSGGAEVFRLRNAFNAARRSAGTPGTRPRAPKMR